jgi:DedD protein
MAFFKFRKGADEPASAPAQPPSVEVIRQRAKYRLVGATVLVLAGVILFPLLLDSQPRSVAVNTPIDIPDKNKMPPLVIPAAATAGKAVASAAAAPAVDIITENAVDVKKVVVAEKNMATAHSVSASEAINGEASSAVKPVTSAKPAASASAKPVAVAPASTSRGAATDSPAVLSKASDAARAKALLEGGASTTVPVVPAANKSSSPAAAQGKASSAKPASSDAPAVEGRFVVQVGAFADAVRAREVRLKVEHAGLKTYTHVAETKEGRRIRVRVGPYPTREEAEKAAAKIKKLDLPAALLTL